MGFLLRILRWILCRVRIAVVVVFHDRFESQSLVPLPAWTLHASFQCARSSFNYLYTRMPIAMSSCPLDSFMFDSPVNGWTRRVEAVLPISCLVAMSSTDRAGRPNVTYCESLGINCRCALCFVQRVEILVVVIFHNGLEMLRNR
jgi:hypothetical protein